MKALPDHGKVILSESVVPQGENDPFKVLEACFDLLKFAIADGGMERTKTQWTKLLDDVRFVRIQFVQLS